MQNDKLSILFQRHYTLLFAVVFLLYTGIAFLAPVLMHFGLTAPAKAIYLVFRIFCHQLPYRSFFLFGAQPFYPLADANMDSRWMTFEEATGFQHLPYEEARLFLGNEMMGYKTALCQRDIAIYLSIALFCVIFYFAKKRIPRIHWGFWVLLGLVPIGLDGFSQLLSRLIPGLLLVRESLPLYRVVTGVLFGFMTSWFVFPYIEKTIQEQASQ